MSEKKADKPSRAAADVDALLTEVTSAAKVKPARAPRPQPAPEAAAEKAPEAAAPAARKTILVRQVKSGICTPEDHKRTLKGLGLSGPRSESTLVDSPSVRGQIRKVRHLVTVVE
ncbi:MAG: 50S ribosomal protein L30 [Acidobacteria bacterium]|nr:MAG: 50S ribosomal protein L30 [Acidobacteriota bacterium]